MDGMMDRMNATMTGMGLISILVIIVLVLVAAALIKYLFFGKRR
jgi:flagellar basal body-associated protein FliL